MGETASLISNFFLAVAARTIAFVDPSLPYIVRVAGALEIIRRSKDGVTAGHSKQGWCNSRTQQTRMV